MTAMKHLARCGWALACAAAITILIAGCSQKTPNGIVGTYVAESSFGRDTLSLRADGSYEQTVVPTDKGLKPFTNSGKWTFDGEHLALRDPIAVYDPYGDGLDKHYGEKKIGAVTLLNVRSRFGSASFSASANNGVQYNRK